ADDEAGVAREKAAIFEGLVPDGVAVLNGDVAFASVLEAGARAAGGRALTFVVDGRHAARLIDSEPATEGSGDTDEAHGSPPVLPLRQSGFHWGLNSLCVLLMLEALDVPLETGLAALAEIQPLAGRGQVTTVRAPGGAFTLVDESYNANPLSMAAG